MPKRNTMRTGVMMAASSRAAPRLFEGRDVEVRRDEEGRDAEERDEPVRRDPSLALMRRRIGRSHEKLKSPRVIGFTGPGRSVHVLAVVERRADATAGDRAGSGTGSGTVAVAH
jgi:hypothetical protein